MTILLEMYPLTKKNREILEVVRLWNG